MTWTNWKEWSLNDLIFARDVILLLIESSSCRLDQGAFWRHRLPGIWHRIWVAGWCRILPEGLHLWCTVPVLHLRQQWFLQPWLLVHSAFLGSKLNCLLPYILSFCIWQWVMLLFVLSFKGDVATTSAPSSCRCSPKWLNWTMSCPALHWGTVAPVRHIRTHEGFHLSMILDQTVEKLLPSAK